MVALFFGASFFFSYNSLVDMGEAAKLPQSHGYYKFVKAQFSTISVYMTAGLFISLVISFLSTIYISHKFAGPIYRLKKEFQNIAESGKVSELKFRDGDFLSDLPEEFNKAFEKVESIKKEDAA